MLSENSQSSGELLTSNSVSRSLPRISKERTREEKKIKRRKEKKWEGEQRKGVEQPVVRFSYPWVVFLSITERIGGSGVTNFLRCTI